ncbi:SPOR domain-containing protein [Qipengyuania atrilutea]|uniref:SPOR domain-containing protein n=1 Tax=Qipengyuania atrilutea TaxID=2744473 RepID=A0A850H5D8_9SPHN|nr:SPOR domain-containing protein [Actirhodobacter atriluteus]NVD45880.1 SPOR domain-containing protein [Actirhodobacter atriluteus]
MAKLSLSAPHYLRSLLMAAGAAAALCLPSAPGSAQSGRAVVQALPTEEVADLNEALRRLATNPRDVRALIEAGSASLELGDLEAAIGFFGRASDLDGNNPDVLNGLGTAYLRTQRPLEALQRYARAESAGADVALIAADRGLALDLLGDNLAAQDQYRLALTRGDDPAVRQRLALSYAISGKRDAFEEVLLPLLQAQDNAAFRTRAFGLAIMGDEAEALSIARAVMPARLAERMEPYLRSMSKLTPVQQASAANMGTFPAANEIGTVNRRFAEARQERAAVTAPAPAPQRTGRLAPQRADTRLAPSGTPLGRTTERPSATIGVIESRPGVVEPSPQPSGPQSLLPARVANASAAPLPATEPAPRQRVNMAEVFADLDTLPSSSEARAPGAVDIASITPAREMPAPKPVQAKPAPQKPAPAEKAAPAQPARIWVQVATGQDRKALAFDWRRLVKKGGDTLEGKGPFVARWGGTNRLLAGPFSSRDAAKGAIAALKEKGIDSFRHDSSEGAVVEKLD